MREFANTGKPGVATSPFSNTGEIHMRTSKLAVTIAGLFIGLANHANATIVSGSVTSGGGSFVKLTVPFTASTPDNTVGENNFDNLNLYGFDEGQNIVISKPLAVDDLANGDGSGTGAGTLAKGTVVASHYVFFDPKDPASQTGIVDFDSKILAVISRTNNLSASDFLIKTGVDYLNPTARGLEAGDSVTISGLKQIKVDWSAANPGDYVRVLTAYSPAGAVPEPSSAMLLGLGLMGLSLLRRRA
jgi:hypothetical protein